MRGRKWWAAAVEPPGLVTRCGGNDVSGRLLHGRVVVTIRGTMSLADALTDVAAEPGVCFCFCRFGQRKSKKTRLVTPPQG